MFKFVDIVELQLVDNKAKEYKREKEEIEEVNETLKVLSYNWTGLS